MEAIRSLEIVALEEKQPLFFFFLVFVSRGVRIASKMVILTGFGARRHLEKGGLPMRVQKRG